MLQSEKDPQRNIKKSEKYKKIAIRNKDSGICSYKAKEGRELGNLYERYMKEDRRVFLNTGWGDITREFVESGFVEY